MASEKKRKNPDRYPEDTRKLEYGERCTLITTEYNIGSSAIYDIIKYKDHLWSLKRLLKWQTLKKPKLSQLDKAAHEWVAAIYKRNR